MRSTGVACKCTALYLRPVLRSWPRRYDEDDEVWTTSTSSSTTEDGKIPRISGSCFRTWHFIIIKCQCLKTHKPTLAVSTRCLASRPACTCQQRCLRWVILLPCLLFKNQIKYGYAHRSCLDAFSVQPRKRNANSLHPKASAKTPYTRPPVPPSFSSVLSGRAASARSACRRCIAASH